MQGFPKHTREPVDILGVAEHASLEDLRVAYVAARTRANRGNALERLGEVVDAPAGLSEIEWAYKELLARFTMAEDNDEDSAVSAVLLPGITPDALSETSAQSNVLIFASPTARKEPDAPRKFALSDDEDDTVLPFLNLDTSFSDANDSDLSNEGIPELREALARAAAPFSREKTSLPTIQKSPVKETSWSTNLVPPTVRAPSHKPWIRGPATPASEGVSRREALPTRTSPSRGQTPARKEERNEARALLEGAVLPGGESPRTIRTVIGGEEREVVNIVARSSHKEDVQKVVQGLLTDAEVLGGPLLRSLRLAMGVEESEICSRIRLAQAQLVALEEDAFDKLPAPVYYRGFVVSYLRYLGLERPDLVDALTENYRAQLRARYFRGNR
ncbi:MAG: helix-turn-helix domain-containing protein [Silvanigrellales bacterium]|nr:helix-turn-helix domain-containing protein [Silvanigrellales bacterium]